METFFWDRETNSSEGDYNICLKEIEGQYSFPLHDHRDMCEFVYVRKGCLTQKINGVKFEQSGGTLVFIREKDTHYSWGRDLSFINIAFPLSWFDKLETVTGENFYLKLLHSNTPIIHTSIPLAEQDGLVKKIETLHRGASNPSSIRFQFLNFLTHVLSYFLPQEEQANPLPHWLHELLSRIHKSTEPVPGVTELSRLSGRTREHLARSFKKYLGLSPSSYLNKRKLDRAAGLLRTTNTRILDICLAVEFESPGYFNRLFKLEYGLTPREYRLRYRGKAFA